MTVRPLVSASLVVSLSFLAACGSGGGTCSVKEGADGSAIVSCPDGSVATIEAPSNGADGVDGAAGQTGASGATGAAGADGTSPVIRTDVEPAGDNCAEGGIAVHVGMDDDGDGALADTEIDDTAYLCDGAEGADGASSLIRMEDLAPGAECAAGGTVVYTGIDDNGDGTLADGEVDDTAYVCDGEGVYTAVTLDFPSSGSATTVSFIGTDVLGAGGGGMYYEAGDFVAETFYGTGLSRVSTLDVAFDMDDQTYDGGCTVGTLTWDVSVNGTTVGTYSYLGGSALGRISFAETYSFAPVAGAGTGGDDYTIAYTATTTVCPGGSSWNWFPGGTAMLGG